MNSSIKTAPVAKLFECKNFAYLATLMEDGSPQVTPVWIDIEGDHLLVNTAHGRLKQRNVSRDPRVAISVVDHSNPYEMVTIRGHVVEQSSNGADDHINKMAKKYLGLDKYPFRQPEEKRVILTVKPDKVFHQKPG